MTEWDFPPKLETFNPKGTMFEQVFKNPIALIAYAQYRRKHIVSMDVNKFLPTFAINFAHAISIEREKKKLEKGTDKLTVEETVEIWIYWWKELYPFPGLMMARDERTKEKWVVMLNPIMPFINGIKTVEVVEENGEYFLVTMMVCPYCKVNARFMRVDADNKQRFFCDSCEEEFNEDVFPLPKD